MLLCRIVGYRPFVFTNLKEEQQLARIRNNQLWGEFGIENGPQYISSPLGTLRPLYLKLQPTSDNVTLSRSTDDVRRSSFSYGSHRGQERFHAEDFTQIRVLTPSVLREKNRNEEPDPDSSTAKITRNGLHENESLTRIPPLQSVNNSRNAQKHLKSFDTSGNDKKLVDDTISKQNGATTIQNGEPESPAPNGILFPSIYSHSNGIPIQDYSYISQQKPSQIQYNDIDESKIQNTMSQLDELLSNSKSGIKSALTSRGGENQSFTAGRIQLTENETILPIPSNITKKISDHSNGIIGDNAKFSDQKQNKSPENTVTTAVAHINGRDQTPSTSSSNSTEFGILNGSGIRLQRLRNGSDKIGFSQKISTSRVPISKNNKITHSGSPFPENLKPFDRPKEGLDTCFSQLESQQWEVVMLGLTSLVRLLRHHPAIVLSQIHPIILALGRQIRNLRSQVSRAACQAAAEMFVALKRNIEVDLEVLAGPLFHRSADTNRFIRLDCGQALDNMTDNISPVKAVNVIISKGSTHQNAIVRTVAARLLLRLSEKVGTEKILTLPKEIRDKVVQTGANLLMEGKLETRAYAKELFRVWSSHPSFSNLMLEAIPPNVMRHISKTLISLKT